MGSSDSKLAFRKGVFRLNEEAEIPADDNDYWNGFHTLPDSEDDVFQLISSVDIRRTISSRPENIKTLVKKLSQVILDFSAMEELPTKAHVKSILNSYRILTRLLPYIYEDEEFEKDLFWTIVVEESKRSNHPEKRLTEKTPDAFLSPIAAEETLAPLAERLLRATLISLFFPGFTLSTDVVGDDKRIRYIIWESGIGASKAPVTGSDHIKHRTEALKCLLVMLSKSMYTQPSDLIKTANPWLHFTVTQLEKAAVLGILCSLLNSIIKYSPSGWVPYDHVFFGDSKEQFAQVASEVLIVLLNYTQGLVSAEQPQASSESLAAEDGQGSSSRRPSVDAILPVKLEEKDGAGFNKFRYFLSKLHRIDDFKIIFDGLVALLVNPLQATNTYLPYSMKQLTFTEEILMIFWKLIEINKKFFSFVCAHENILNVAASLVFQLLSSKNNISRVGMLRMASFILHVLSGERSFAVLLNRPLNAQMPANLELPPFRGCYGDLVVLSLFTVIFTTKGKFMNLYDCFLTVIANISPYIKSFCVVTANKLLLMFTTFTNPTFLLSNESNHILVFFLLDTFNNILQYQFDGNPHVVYEILRHKDSVFALNNLTFEKAFDIWEKAKTKKQLLKQQAINVKASVEHSDDQLNETRSEPSMSPVSTAHEADHYPATTPNSPTQYENKQLKQQGNDQSRKFEPTKDWFDYWHEQLPLHTITSLLENLAPQIEHLCEENNWYDEAVLQFLQSGTLVGLLPVPHPIFVRKFQFSDGIYIWFSSYMWGVVYLRHTSPLPTIWVGSKVKLFMVKTVDSTEM